MISMWDQTRWSEESLFQDGQVQRGHIRTDSKTCSSASSSTSTFWDLAELQNYQTYAHAMKHYTKDDKLQVLALIKWTWNFLSIHQTSHKIPRWYGKAAGKDVKQVSRAYLSYCKAESEACWTGHSRTKNQDYAHPRIHLPWITFNQLQERYKMKNKSSELKKQHAQIETTASHSYQLMLSPRPSRHRS